jgi:hypothetical protein
VITGAQRGALIFICLSYWEISELMAEQREARNSDGRGHNSDSDETATIQLCDGDGEVSWRRHRGTNDNNSRAENRSVGDFEVHATGGQHDDGDDEETIELTGQLLTLQRLTSSPRASVTSPLLVDYCEEENRGHAIDTATTRVVIQSPDRAAAGYTQLREASHMENATDKMHDAGNLHSWLRQQPAIQLLGHAHRRRRF